MTEDALYASARQEVRAAVARLTANLGDPSSAAHDPLARIRAARRLEWAARDNLRSGAHQARADGLRWSRIGEALGFADRPGPGLASVAERAFLTVASDLGSGQSFGFTCGSCGRAVLDYGPEMPPAEAERGHGDGCERFTATVAAWDASWEDSSEEGDESGGLSVSGLRR